jgi:drug/metabolite transporter (DMT)-like permease
MLAWCALAGKKISITKQDFWRLLTVGVLLLSLANIGVLWAEEYVPSGLTALIVAFVPIWVAMLEAWVFRVGDMPARGLFGLALGIGGMGLLLWPKIASGTHLGRMELVGAAILCAASLSWALGSILSHRWTLSVGVLASAAWQMTLGGIVNTAVAAAGGQFSRAHWTVSGMWSIAYLILCGSWIGYTAYIWLLEHVPPPKVATYAYVNPIIAVLLGWLLLNEKVDGFMLLGTAVIVAAVALVSMTKLKREDRVEEGVELPAVNATAD